MDEMTKSLIDGLRKAMQAERTGAEFYKMAAKTTQDAGGKQTFEQLAREEIEHYEFLRSHYESIVKTGRLGDAKLGHGTELKGDSPIFSDGLRARMKEAHFEMSALAIAVQLELNGINHYKAEAAKAKDPEVKKFYEELVKWETVHYDAFIKQQQLLQEEYWQEAGFEPF